MGSQSHRIKMATQADLVKSLKEQALNQNRLSNTKGDTAKLTHSLAIQEKIRARKRAQQKSDSSGFESEQSHIEALREQAEKEGKLIQAYRTTDKVEHKISLEEKLRNRKKRQSKGTSSSKLKLFSQKNYHGKSELYGNKENLELFGALEQAAIDYCGSKEIPASWEDLLTNTFCVGKLTDLEIARIIFHYITAQNLDELTLPDTTVYDVHEPASALIGIKHGKIRYSDLYAHLCEIAGLKAQVVTGKVKGANWNALANLDDCENSWNAVKINDEYKLVDPHWGARHISDNDSGDIKYEYEEFCFCPNPEELLYTHYPDRDKFQLSKKNLSKEDFQKRPKTWPLFWKLGMSFGDNCIVNTIPAPNGIVDISVAVSKDYVSLTQLIHSVTRNEEKFNEWVFHYRKMSSKIDIFECKFPFAGRYRFEI